MVLTTRYNGRVFSMALSFIPPRQQSIRKAGLVTMTRRKLKSSAPQPISLEEVEKQERRPLHVCNAIADSQRLSPMKLENLLTAEGRIYSNQTETTRASVFAVFDGEKKLQYIGFSKGLQESLRTVFTRRPEKAHYYKSANLTKLDQKEMVEIRDTWFEEVGGPPAGNKLAMERAAWQQPAEPVVKEGDSKQKAAEALAASLLEQIRERGCKEEFIVDPDALENGQVDLVFMENLSEKEIAEKEAKVVAMNKATRKAITQFQDKESEFSVYFKSDFLANGGTAFDVIVSHNEQDTSHRVIVSDEYYASPKVEAEDVIMQTFAFVIKQELERQTEGLLLMSQFPINYFTISDLDQRFVEYREHFKEWTGVEIESQKFWLFRRVDDYGAVVGYEAGYELPIPRYEDEDESFMFDEDEETAEL